MFVISFLLVITIIIVLVCTRKPKKSKKISSTTEQNHISEMSSSSTDYMDDLVKIKELLDSGAITSEEFEKEKQEILSKAKNIFN